MRRPLLAFSALALIGMVTIAAPQTSTAQSGAAGVPTAYRRLTESQYHNTIADAFGPGIQVNARFEPERREDGLQAVGNARLSITPAGLEQYYAAARSIADQVIDGKEHDAQVACLLVAIDNGAACADRFLADKGAQLFRRPLTAAERAQFVGIWREGSTGYKDYYKGLKLALVGVLMSPDFLFRVEHAEPDPAQPSALRLDGFTKASRLSYLLWDAAPDAELIRAAQTGEIHTEAGLQKQVDRLLASPRLEAGVRAFFTDMLEFEAFESLSKDTTAYPKFSGAVGDSAREETLKFLVGHLVTQGGDYRDIFTSRQTWIDRTLAYVYNVPYLSTDKWSSFTFDEASERSGVLTQVTFLSLFAHPGSSSPTIRGVKLSEIFLCVQIPQPPPDVDFSKVQALEKGTVRTRLLDHMTNPGCSGCHRISDPVGLTLEHFDGLGQRRLMENNALIDVSAELGGKKLNGAQELGSYLHDDPRAASCLVRKVHAYGVGRTADTADGAYLIRVDKAFAAGGYRFPGLLRAVLNDPQFFRVIVPASAPPAARVAKLDAVSLSVSGDTSFGDAR